MTPGEVIAWIWFTCLLGFVYIYLRDIWEDRDARKRIQRHLAHEPVVLYVVEPVPDLDEEASEDWFRDLESIQALRVFKREQW